MPDELWTLAEPLLPPFSPCPQGGGTAQADERAMFNAVVFVLMISANMDWRSALAIKSVTISRSNNSSTSCRSNQPENQPWDVTAHVDWTAAHGHRDPITRHRLGAAQAMPPDTPIRRQFVNPAVKWA
ncbi:transposase [Nocardia brasiliensis]|uniref:transposase n=1 Tax=Nocardia brasiliensis TaxID=37326 RepID=UPI0009DDC28D|nr:transposase [Nocardia brasiliensis]